MLHHLRLEFRAPQLTYVSCFVYDMPLMVVEAWWFFTFSRGAKVQKLLRMFKHRDDDDYSTTPMKTILATCKKFLRTPEAAKVRKAATQAVGLGYLVAHRLKFIDRFTLAHWTKHHAIN